MAFAQGVCSIAREQLGFTFFGTEEEISVGS